MVSKDIEVGARGARVFIVWTYFPIHLGLNFDEDDRAPNGKQTMKVLREGHHLNRGRLKVK
jgi:hypothetical protein